MRLLFPRPAFGGVWYLTLHEMGQSLINNNYGGATPRYGPQSVTRPAAPLPEAAASAVPATPGTYRTLHHNHMYTFSTIATFGESLTLSGPNEKSHAGVQL